MLSEDPNVATLATAIVGLSSQREDELELIRLIQDNAGQVIEHAFELTSGLDPFEHSVACLYIHLKWLHSLGHGNNLEYIQSVSRFVKKCHGEKVEKHRQALLEVVLAVKMHAVKMEQPRLAILPLLHAIPLCSPGKQCLSPLHPALFEMCLRTRHYSLVKDLLFADFHEMDPTVTFLTPTDFLLYCYYAGRICISLKLFQRALELFHLALSAPTLASNAITLMIYKFYVLVSLLEDGEGPELMRYTASSVQRMIRSALVTPYVRLADAFKETGKSALWKVVEDFKQVFEQDHCLGLVQQVIDSSTKRDIQKLARVYITKSLGDIAAYAEIETEEEAEHVILRMAKEKQITVHIHPESRIVTFLDEACLFDNAKGTAQLGNMIQEVIELGERMQDIKDKIELDPEYRLKVFQSKQNSKLDG